MKLTQALLVSPALLTLASTAVALQTSTTRVSVATSGAEGNWGGDTPTISADGRFVAFCSNSNNLVPGDTNSGADVFLRDRLTGTTERISLAPGGGQANQTCKHPRISADGRFIAFEGDATNLVPGDTNASTDVFVYDRISGTTERVSVATSGAQGNSNSFLPAISADGRWVAFASMATNLVTGDTNANDDIFLRDRTSGTTERVSVATGGAQATAWSGLFPSISDDGRFVAFSSAATNLVTGDTNGMLDAFVRDRVNATTERVSVDSAGLEGDDVCYSPSISADGRFVAFFGNATNLVAGDNNAVGDIFVRDRLNATTVRASVGAAGTEADGYNDTPWISGDGQSVAFYSYATNLVAGDTNGVPDVFVRNLTGGTTIRASVASNGAQATSDCIQPALSIDGRFVLFSSPASNLVPGDTNGQIDAFVFDRGPQVPISYCTSGTTTNGCIASIAGSGQPSVSLASACTITITGVEGAKTGILFYGIDNTAFVPGPWGAGSTSSLCVKQPTQRTPVQNSGGTFGACNGSFVLDWNAYQATHPLALGNPWSFADKVYVQAWFRDPLAVKSTNLSNALEMKYEP